MEEGTLIEGCKKKERKFQELLYKRLSRKMFGVCLGYANNHDDAKDILQEGFIKVFETIGQFNGEGAIDAWVRRIIVNTAIDKYRKNAKVSRLSLDLLPEQQEPADHSLSDKIDMDDFLELIRELPEGCRLIFNLHVVEGYKHKEIAEMLNISEGTSKSQVYQAKKILQKKIETAFGKTFFDHERRIFKLVP